MSEFLSHSESDTVAFARSFAGQVPRGATILLVGDLGAGKTAFVRGLATGLGVAESDVSSPTFTIVQEYHGADRRIALYHVDLYRLTAREVDDLGLEEITGADAVAAIEWAERLPRPIPGALRVEIRDEGDDVRRIVIGSGIGYQGSEIGEQGSAMGDQTGR